MKKKTSNNRSINVGDYVHIDPDKLFTKYEWAVMTKNNFDDIFIGRIGKVSALSKDPKLYRIVSTIGLEERKISFPLSLLTKVPKSKAVSILVKAHFDRDKVKIMVHMKQ